MRPVGEFLHSEFREPSTEAAALFKRLTAKSKEREEIERTPDIKLIKLCCMSCGVENEFKEVNEESKEICRNCNKPIFHTTEDEK